MQHRPSTPTLIDPDASVVAVLHAALVPRLTAVGALELAAVSTLLDTVRLDVRALARCGKRGGALSVADLDKLCSFGGVDAPFAAFVW
jgi:hypothetical protein